jgi:hypothetical protein
VLELVREVHNKRYQSYLAHPKIGNTTQPTGRIPFGFIKVSKRLLLRAIAEIGAAGLA